MYLISYINELMKEYEKTASPSDIFALQEHIRIIKFHLTHSEQYRKMGDYQRYAQSLREALGYLENISVICDVDDKQQRVKLSTLLEIFRSDSTTQDKQQDLGVLAFDVSQSAASILTTIGTQLIVHCDNIRYFDYPLNCKDDKGLKWISNDAIMIWQTTYQKKHNELTSHNEATVDFDRNITILGQACDKKNKNSEFENEIDARIRFLLDQTSAYKNEALEKDALLTWLKKNGGQKNSLLASWLAGTYHFTTQGDYASLPSIMCIDPIYQNWDIDQESGKVCFYFNLDIYQVSPGDKDMICKPIMMGRSGNIKPIDTEDPEYDEMTEKFKKGDKATIGPVLSILAKIELNTFKTSEECVHEDKESSELDDFVVIERNPYKVVPSVVDLRGLMYTPLLTSAFNSRNEMKLFDLLTNENMLSSVFINRLSTPIWADKNMLHFKPASKYNNLSGEKEKLTGEKEKEKEKDTHQNTFN